MKLVIVFILSIFSCTKISDIKIGNKILGRGYAAYLSDAPESVRYFMERTEELKQNGIVDIDYFLTLAINAQHSAAIIFCLSEGAAPRTKGSDGQTSLHVAYAINSQALKVRIMQYSIYNELAMLTNDQGQVPSDITIFMSAGGPVR